MLQQLREVIDRDYASVIKRKMDEVYKNSGPTPSNVRPDRIERENRVSFIVSQRISLRDIELIMRRG